MTEFDHPFTLHGYSETPTPGVARRVQFSARERWVRAGKALGALWGAAVVAVFIPVAHLILVPALTLAGPVAFGLGLRRREVTAAVHGRCPDCGTEQDFGARGPWRPPVAVTCRACSRTVVARDPAGEVVANHDAADGPAK